ncbi:MAG TPA: hypothetical protein VGD13_14240 [Xanthobacteraceae bacterium]
MTAIQKKDASQGPRPAEGQGEHTQLDLRYGAIGISAVAAALRYAGGGKNQKYAPVVHHPDERFFELAA